MPSLFPLHPRFVHFPVAFLLAGSLAILAYLLGWRRSGLSALGWAMLCLGWLSLFAAILSGLVDQNRAPQDEAIIAVLNPHIAAGFGLVIIYGLLLYERLRNPEALNDKTPRWRLLLLLIPGIVLVLVEGWLGGRLVYQLGVGVGG